MDYRIIGYVALGMLALYIGFCLMERYALRKLAQMEYERILNSDEHKVKGRYE
ncbi:MAG: hypothetical protein QW165_02395 [Candidatus Woesearchaeota archaeon]